MARRTLTVDRHEEIKRRLADGRGVREIAASLNCSRRLVRQIRDGERQTHETAASPDPLWMSQLEWPVIIHELGLGFAMKDIWEERAKALITYPNFWKQFYRKFPQYREATLTAREFEPGERVEVDYAGDPFEWYEIKTGEIRKAYVFVSGLGFSQLLFAWAAEDMKSRNWLGCHRRMFEYYGGVSHVTVPDCLKTGVVKCHLYDPDLNEEYAYLAAHFSTAIVPARVRKPRDKASVEMSVLVVQRWILARLRNRQFFSLRELNQAIAELLTDLNRRSFKKLPGSRITAFESIDRPAMKPLPPTRYEYAEWSKAKVGIDYHAEGDRHYYSVPHTLVGEHVMVRLTDTTAECFFKGRRVAAHERSYQKGRHTTLPEHMPSAHRKHMKWTPGRLLNWGQNIGAGTRAVVQWQLENRPHPEQGYRACLGLLNLSKTYGEERLEAACRRALAIGAPHRKRIIAILKAKLDQHPDLFPAADTAAATASRTHGNVRGADYFRDSTTTTETTTTDEGDDDSCLPNPRSIH